MGTQGLNCLSLAIYVIDPSPDIFVSSSVLYLGDNGLEHIDGCSLVVLLGVAGVSVTCGAATDGWTMLWPVLAIRYCRSWLMVVSHCGPVMELLDGMPGC